MSIHKNHKPFSQRKAKEVLSEKHPTLKGKPISEKQRGLLGVIAGGKTPTRMKKRREMSSDTGKVRI